MRWGSLTTLLQAHLPISPLQCHPRLLKLLAASRQVLLWALGWASDCHCSYSVRLSFGYSSRRSGGASRRPTARFTRLMSSPIASRKDHLLSTRLSTRLVRSLGGHNFTPNQEHSFLDMKSIALALRCLKKSIPRSANGILARVAII